MDVWAGRLNTNTTMQSFDTVAREVFMIDDWEVWKLNSSRKLVTLGY